jgi:hypothetical protein
LLPGTEEEEVTQGTFFPFAARDRRRKLHRELFFLLLPGTEEEEVTHGTFFPFDPSFLETWTDRRIDG